MLSWGNPVAESCIRPTNSHSRFFLFRIFFSWLQGIISYFRLLPMNADSHCLACKCPFAILCSKWAQITRSTWFYWECLHSLGYLSSEMSFERIENGYIEFLVDVAGSMRKGAARLTPQRVWQVCARSFISTSSLHAWALNWFENLLCATGSVHHRTHG